MDIIVKTAGEDFPSRIAQMFENVIHQGHGSLVLVFLIRISTSAFVALGPCWSEHF